jgi:serine/threonine protein phosphatase PrpC
MQVFDGHSGAGAAHFARDHLCDYFAGYLQADNLEPNEMQEAMVSLWPFLQECS